MIELALGGIIGLLFVHTFTQQKYLLDIKYLLQDLKKIQLRIEHNNRTSGGQDA